MATSGSTDWKMSRDEIIKDALLDVDGVSIYTTPTANQISHAARRLNALIKALQAEPPGIWIHKRDLQTVSIDAVSETLAAGTLGVLEFYLRIDSTDTPLEIITQEEYDELRNKSGTGQPTKVFIDSVTSNTPVAYFYPTPASTYTGYYRRVAILEDMDAAANDIDLPVQATDMIIKGLAYELSVPYGLNEDKVQRCYMRFKEAKIGYLAFQNQERKSQETKPPKGAMIV